MKCSIEKKIYLSLFTLHVSINKHCLYKQTILTDEISSLNDYTVKKFKQFFNILQIFWNVSYSLQVNPSTNFKISKLQPIICLIHKMKSYTVSTKDD